MKMDSTMRMDTTMRMGQRGMGMRGMMGMMTMMQNCSIMSAMGHGPQMALMHREQLDLSASQVQKLEALQGDVKRAMTRAMQQMQPLQQQIAKSTTGDQFNEQTARSAFQQMGALHTGAAVAMLRASYQTQQILTPEQRHALAKVGGGMMGMGKGGMMGKRGMMGGGMQGGMGMQGCPMMQSGMGGMPMHGADSSSMQHHRQK